MLMGAPRNALRAFNAGVSLSCLCILAHRLPHLFRSLVLSLTCLVGVPSCGLATGSWRTGRPAPHRQIVSVCLMLPGGFLCQGRSGQLHGKGLIQLVLNQFRSKSSIETMSFVSSRLRKSSSTWKWGKPFALGGVRRKFCESLASDNMSEDKKFQSM